MLFFVFSSHLFWTSSLLDVPAGVTQEEGHTGFLIQLLSAVRALIFLARRIQPFLSLVDFVSEKNPVDRDLNSRPNVSEGYEVTSELPGRPCVLCFLPIHSGLQWTYQPGSHREKVTQDFSSTFFLRCLP